MAPPRRPRGRAERGNLDHPAGPCDNRRMSAPSPTSSAAGLGVILRALSFAADKHRNQRRKDEEASPYINHPIDLANVLVNEGGVADLQVITAAILHDTVEDTDTTLDEITEAFGAEVSAVVAEVTDDKNLPKAERKRLQEVHARTISHRARLLKLADKISNLRDVARRPPDGWSLERKREYFDWARRVVDGLRGANPQLEALFDEVYKARP
jgi:guanosine-3',5'-bis(diphosphate) 3'-pyrophosphohydrolase